MNAAHLHLLLNHIPVVGVGIALLGLIAAHLRRSDELARASLGLLVLLTFSAIATYLTGDPAEDVIRNLPDFSRDAVHLHDSAASVALTAMCITGVFSLYTLYRWRREPVLPRWALSLAFALTLITTGLMAYTANLGGMVRHTEIRTSQLPTMFTF